MFFSPFSGPVDTDSNEELIETRRHRSQSFSVPSPTTTSKRVPLHQTADSDDSIHTDSSEAPNFNLPQELESPKSHSSHNMRSTAEPGRDKILFKECQEDTCNLIGRDFPQEEYLLSSKDVSSVRQNNLFIISFFTLFRFNHKFLLAGMFILTGFYFTALEETAFPSQLCIIN